MLKHIINIFRVNIPLKVISVAIAFLLWFVVVNVSNPEVTDSVTMEIEVNYGDELVNAGKSFTLDSRTVRISYNVRTSYRSQIQPSSFNAYVDMRDYSVTGAVPVYVEVDPAAAQLISGVRQTPMVIHVSTENMQEKSFPISAVIEGTPADGFVCREVQLTPETVTVYGPVSEIGKISRVGVTVDASGVSETQEGTAKAQCYDANDNVTTLSSNVTFKSNVQYVLPVYRTKSLSINVPTTGQPEHGYTLTGVETEPRFVQVYGEDEVLDHYNTIYLPEGLLDITGVNSNVTISVAIQNYLPEGLYLVQQSDASIVARIARQTDLIPGAAGLPAATIQAPPAAGGLVPESTAAQPSQEAVISAPETEAPADDGEIQHSEENVSEEYEDDHESAAEVYETPETAGEEQTHDSPEASVPGNDADPGTEEYGPGNAGEPVQTVIEPLPEAGAGSEAEGGEEVVSPGE